jgi:uncharacterized lipoprotein YajG
MGFSASEPMMCGLYDSPLLSLDREIDAMDEYTVKAGFMALMAASLVLAGCSKPSVEPTPAQTAPEPVAPAQTAQEPVAVKIDPVQQAATIAGYIDGRPECAVYHEQLAAANSTTTSAELVAVLEKAHKAGCSKKN